MTKYINREKTIDITSHKKAHDGYDGILNWREILHIKKKNFDAYSMEKSKKDSMGSSPSDSQPQSIRCKQKVFPTNHALPKAYKWNN